VDALHLDERVDLALEATDGQEELVGVGGHRGSVVDGDVVLDRDILELWVAAEYAAVWSQHLQFSCMRLQHAAIRSLQYH
jgi:hypothetical protein